MILSIEDAQYAPSYIRKIMMHENLEAKAYAVFKYEDNPTFPTLRDRTDELTKAVKGISGRNSYKILDYTGFELCRDYDAMCTPTMQKERYRFIFS